MVDTPDNNDITDSDDDLLGIDNEPVQFRTIRHSSNLTAPSYPSINPSCKQIFKNTHSISELGHTHLSRDKGQFYPKHNRGSQRIHSQLRDVQMTENHPQRNFRSQESYHQKWNLAQSSIPDNNCSTSNDTYTHNKTNNEGWIQYGTQHKPYARGQRTFSRIENSTDDQKNKLSSNFNTRYSTGKSLMTTTTKDKYKPEILCSNELSCNLIISTSPDNKIENANPKQIDGTSARLQTDEICTPINSEWTDDSMSQDWNNIIYDNRKIAKYNDRMETMDYGIDIRSDNRNNRYQRMREIRDVTGFIVNVHDATNFDIDLDISPDLHEKYHDVISNQYTYQDLGIDFLENPDMNRLVCITPEIGTTYRCRLRGVGINQLSSSEHTWKSTQMCVDVKQLIDRTDGWISCTLSDIDVYQRLLVDITIFTCNGAIDLREYLLIKMLDEENPIFYPYSGKRDRVILRDQ